MSRQTQANSSVVIDCARERTDDSRKSLSNKYFRPWTSGFWIFFHASSSMTIGSKIVRPWFFSACSVHSSSFATQSRLCGRTVYKKQQIIGFRLNRCLERTTHIIAKEEPLFINPRTEIVRKMPLDFTNERFLLAAVAEKYLHATCSLAIIIRKRQEACVGIRKKDCDRRK